MPERAVIFDLDGTLIDTAPDLMLATNHVLATLGRRPITMQEVRAFVGNGARALIARGCEATGAAVAPRAVETLYQEFIIHYAQNIAQDSVAYPGLTGFLDRCRAEGIYLGICTNKLESLSIKLLEALGLRHYFGAIVGPDTIGVAKPDPKPFHETVARLGLRNASAVMVGDSEIDILTARAAGVPIIAVPFGYSPRPIAEYGPDFIVTHYDDMWETLGRAFDR